MYHIKRFPWLVVSLAVIALATIGARVVHAQCSTYAVFEGEGAEDRFGKSVNGAGDVDGDGYADVIVGAWANENGGADAGAAYVYSGQTTALIYAWYGEADLDNFGWSVAGVGDVNSDGRDDVIVGARNAGGTGKAYLYSGMDGSLLHTFVGALADDVFGWSVAKAGDVNGDLIPDIIIGAPCEIALTNPGSAYVYSGADYSQLHVFTGESAGDAFGSEVSGAGDVNLDGRADVIVGARFNDAGGMDAGRAYVYSGLDGSSIHVFTGASAGNGFGFSVSGGVDLNEDTYPDLIVSANDAGNVGAVHTFSGQTGALLYTLVGEAIDDEFGRSVAGVGDLSNDGVPDVVVGAKFNDAGGNNAGRAYIYSGKTGALLHVFTGEAIRRNLGTSVASAGDVNLDGVDDVIVGGPRRGRGLANVYTCIPPAPIPTISEWGAVIFGTILLASVVFYIRRRRIQYA